MIVRQTPEACHRIVMPQAIKLFILTFAPEAFIFRSWNQRPSKSAQSRFLIFHPCQCYLLFRPGSLPSWSDYGGCIKNYAIPPTIDCWSPSDWPSFHERLFQESSAWWMSDSPVCSCYGHLCQDHCAQATIDVNQLAGSRPSFSDALKSWVESFTRTSAGGFTIAGWMPSSPANFNASNF